MLFSCVVRLVLFSLPVLFSACLYYSYMLGSGSHAQWPDNSRIVDAMCVELSRIYPAGKSICGVRQDRWALVKRDYSRIRDLVLANPTLKTQTTIQLFEVNNLTLRQW